MQREREREKHTQLFQTWSDSAVLHADFEAPVEDALGGVGVVLQDVPVVGQDGLQQGCPRGPVSR